jgi:outer membrane protein OmpA-like peptidoglycan-associated protein
MFLAGHFWQFTSPVSSAWSTSMSSRGSTRFALLIVAPLALQACATKGFVRREVAVSRAAVDSAIVAERDARMAADNDLASRIAGLRVDLDSLRTQFGARIAAMEDGLRFAMPVTFAFDDANVRAQHQPMLERFVRVAEKYYPGSTITIEGFADPAGSQSYNMTLSRRRAMNVMQTLQSLGLDENPLRPIGYGESRAVVPGAEKFESGAESNRRVVFVIESAGREAAIALGPSLR